MPVIASTSCHASRNLVRGPASSLWINCNNLSCQLDENVASGRLSEGNSEATGGEGLGPIKVSPEWFQMMGKVSHMIIRQRFE